MNLGAEIKRIRLSQELTLEQLSEKCSYSKALISRIETGAVSPSLRSFRRMVAAMGMQPHEVFLSIEQAELSVLRKEDRPRFRAEDKAAIEFLATGVSTKKMEPVKITVPPKYTSGKEPTATYSEQFVYVTSGKIEMAVDKHVYKFGPGDSISLEAGASLKWRNIGKEPAEMIFISTPPQL